ncbi:MAG TPA: hypothetical protein VLG49_05800, partial [Rhabdochlamydiaceae bacterium]|nr:hypothetical protein [Rhabdochlamydiaceae bacterium]
MSVFLTGFINQAKSCLCGNHQEVQSTPKTSAEVFAENLSTFSAMSMRHEEYFENSIKSVKDILQTTDCDLSETSKKAIGLHLEIFNKAVNETRYFS